LRKTKATKSGDNANGDDNLSLRNIAIAQFGAL